MKKILGILILVFIISCGKVETVSTPDYKGLIDSNILRIELLETNDALQDLRLDALESTVQDLDSRLLEAEDDIDLNESRILSLFSRTNYLAAGLSYLYNDLHRHVRELEAADRSQRVALRSSIRSLRRKLSREVRQRRLADANLQSQIDDLESDLSSFEARQSIINRFLTRGLAISNFRISQLQSQVSRSLSIINSNINLLQSQVTSINLEVNSIKSEITTIQNQISDMESDISDLEDSVTKVVYPCGEGSSEEVLLQTQDGLVAYFQQTRNQTDNFSIGQAIPEHFVCDRFYSSIFGSNRCKQGRNIPASTATSNISVTHQVLVKAYLDVLNDGRYRTTDGYSCNFEIENGEVK